MSIYWNQDTLDTGISIHALALGDSWLYYIKNNLLTAIDKHIGTCNILAFGANGERASGLNSYVNQIKNLLKTYWTIKAVIISAGGNDFAGVGDLDKVILNNKCENFEDVESCYRENQPEDLFKEIINHYREIIKTIIDTIKDSNRHILVLVHNYDYPIPNGKFLIAFLHKFGPWLKDPMDNCGVRDADNPETGLRRQICVDLIDKFTQELKILAKEYENNKYVNLELIDSAGTLSNDQWANELHPTVKGFEKIVTKCWKKPIRKAIGLAN